MTARRGRRKGGGHLRNVALVLVGAALGGALFWILSQGGPEALRGRPGGARREGEPQPTSVPSPTPPSRAARPPGVPPDFEEGSEGTRGLLALVIDDLGYSTEALARLRQLGGPVALAVLPDAPHAAQAAALAREKGWDLLVHLPMESEGEEKAEPATLLTGAGGEEVRRTVENALVRVPGAIGLNNHQGSAATKDVRLVRELLAAVRPHGLFVLDSRTTPGSVLLSEARRAGVPSLARDVFLDATAAESPATGEERASLAAAWTGAVAIARKRGDCVVIGHPHGGTLDFLAETLPGLGKKGPALVRISELLDQAP